MTRPVEFNDEWEDNLTSAADGDPLGSADLENGRPRGSEGCHHGRQRGRQRDGDRMDRRMTIPPAGGLAGKKPNPPPSGLKKYRSSPNLVKSPPSPTGGGRRRSGGGGGGVRGFARMSMIPLVAIGGRFAGAAEEREADRVERRMEYYENDLGALPSFENMSRLAWVFIGCQIIIGIFGAAISWHIGTGVLGGVVSGITGLWFVLCSWTVTLPRRCSVWPFRVGLVLLPLTKAVGFLFHTDDESDPTKLTPDWTEFLKRMAILSCLWSLPMFLCGTATHTVLRDQYGDYIQTEEDILRTTRMKGDGDGDEDKDEDEDYEIDPDRILVRSSAMGCMAQQFSLLPAVVFLTFNAVGGFTEASEYAEYATSTGDDFESKTGRQFYMDYTRMGYSNVMQGLVLVFTVYTLTAFKGANFSLGELIKFRLAVWETICVFINMCFFVFAVYFGSALFDPTDAVQDMVCYWVIFALPAALLLSLWRLSASVDRGTHNLWKRRSDDANASSSYNRSVTSRRGGSSRRSMGFFSGVQSMSEVKTHMSRTTAVMRQESRNTMELEDRIWRLEETIAALSAGKAHSSALPTLAE